MPVTGVPKGRVGVVVQDAIDFGATRVEVNEELGGTYTVDAGGGGGAVGLRGGGAASIGGGGGEGARAAGSPRLPGVGSTATFAEFNKAVSAMKKAKPSSKGARGGARKSGGARKAGRSAAHGGTSSKPRKRARPS